MALDKEVIEVLERSTITDNIFRLPEQLDRKLYEKVAKAIKGVNGKWVKKVQGFYEKNGEWFISFSRINKRTLKIGGKTAIMESMSYKSFIENMPNFNK